MNIEYGKCYQYGTLRGDSDTFHQRLAWEVFDTVINVYVLWSKTWVPCLDRGMVINLARRVDMPIIT